MACCTFNVLEVRTITPNRFKNQSCGTLKILAHIPTINKGLLNEKMLFSIIVVLRQNFLNTFIKIAILCKIYQCSNCYANLKQHWVECICVHSSPIFYLLSTKKPGLSISVHFHKNFLILTCCTLIRLKIRTLTPNRLKNQTNDMLKLLGHNYNHQRGSLKQKIVTLHCCGFSLNF